MKRIKEQKRCLGRVPHLRMCVAWMLVPCCMMSAGCGTWQTKDAMAEADEKVEVSISRKGISIGNDYIAREYKIKQKHINTSAIQNKRMDEENLIEMQEGSEDFVIRLFDADAPSKELDKTGYKVTVTNGDGMEIPQSEAARLIDGSTLVHPQLAGTAYEKAPFTVDIDLGSAQTIRSFGVDKRAGDCEETNSVDGTMGKYQLYVSEDGVNYMPAGEGEFTKEAYHLHEGAGLCLSHYMWEDHIYNVGERVYANFDQAYTVRYVRFVQESCALGTTDDSFSSTEITLYEDAYGGNGETDAEESTIAASELKYAGAEVENVEDGKKLTIHYKPFDVNGNTYDINQVVVLKNDDFYMRSYLEIEAEDSKQARVDYIDMNSFILPEDTKDVWDEGMYAIGQPLYAGGLFLGSEFPAVHTWISHENATQIRYYSGKSFARMKEDGQLTEDGRLVTWPSVIGASWDTNTKVVQTDFYQYIEEIATPTEFRKQYNSWFDNGMGITDKSIKKAFFGVEKGLTQNGMEPLDCYVVDDGWNNYYDGIYQMKSGKNQGKTQNETGFWETNAKFPNELYTASALTDSLQSAFGMWLGPQGGYTYDKNFSQFLEYSGTGHVRTENMGDGTTVSSYVCVASDTYLANLRSFMIDYNTKYDITYWKLDGMGGACQNLNHGHMTGGYCDMYYISDMWEKWISLFEDVRAAREEEGRELFINATNGTILSPWILQWVNTVWLNMGDDTGEIGTGERHQQKIYYRDQVYYNQFGNLRQVQFPFGHLYNHDPIYAVSDKSEASPEVFREYLFANAMRGTSLWEVYFSPSVMEDAYWQIATDVMTWAEENHDVLKNARYFGNDPAEGVYGYACFRGSQGILSFTNPLDEAQTYTLTVDGTAGATKSFQKAAGYQVYPYEEKDLGILNYGDTITVELAPHQTIVQQYGVVDTKEPEIVSARSEGVDCIIVKFDERVYPDSCIIEGVQSEVSLQEDYRTVVLQSGEALSGTKQIHLRVRDACGNVCEDSITVQCCGEDNTVIRIADTRDIKDADDITVVYDETTDTAWMESMHQSYEVLTEYELIGKGAFTISTGVQTEGVDMNLVTAGDEVKLSIDSEGYAVFTVGDMTISSLHNITTVTKKAYGVFGTESYVPTQTQTKTAGMVNDGKAHAITAVREANGMLKLYLDGELCASCYDEEKPCYDLAGGMIRIADESFAGKLAEVIILNDALGYDEVSTY